MSLGSTHKVPPETEVTYGGSGRPPCNWIGGGTYFPLNGGGVTTVEVERGFEEPIGTLIVPTMTIG